MLMIFWEFLANLVKSAVEITPHAATNWVKALKLKKWLDSNILDYVLLEESRKNDQNVISNNRANSICNQEEIDTTNLF